MKRWDVTVRLAEKYGLRSFVEVGVNEGKHVAEILRCVPGSTVVAVDPWADWSLENPKAAEKKFDKVAAQFPGRVWKMKMLGHEAACQFKDASIDFVFIDDDHRYATIKANVDAWMPKVRAGGILAGHDYRNGFPGVDRFLRERFPNFNTEPDHVWWLTL